VSVLYIGLGAYRAENTFRLGYPKTIAVYSARNFTVVSKFAVSCWT